MTPVPRCLRNSGGYRRRRQAALAALAVLACLALGPAAAAQSLFARHVVDVQFATRDGKPMADAEVEVFAPGKPDKPAETGHTDKNGKFSFEADEDGMWSAEAHTGGEIARLTIRVGDGTDSAGEGISPYVLLGGLLVLLGLAVVFRVWRARLRRVSSSPPGSGSDRPARRG